MQAKIVMSNTETGDVQTIVLSTEPPKKGEPHTIYFVVEDVHEIDRSVNLIIKDYENRGWRIIKRVEIQTEKDDTAFRSGVTSILVVVVIFGLLIYSHNDHLYHSRFINFLVKLLSYLAIELLYMWKYKDKL